MDLELTEELAEVQKLARDFAEKEIAPTAAKDDREHIFRKDLVIKMGDLGFYGCLVPEERGGNGLGFLAHALISEEIARAHSAIRVYVNMQAGPAVTLCEFGSEERAVECLRVERVGQEIAVRAQALRDRFQAVFTAVRDQLEDRLRSEPFAQRGRLRGERFRVAACEPRAGS